MKDKWFKRNETDKVWWLTNSDFGEFVFSFDQQQKFNLFRDYPHALSEKELEIFDKENQFWRKFFSDRRRGNGIRESQGRSAGGSR